MDGNLTYTIFEQRRLVPFLHPSHPLSFGARYNSSGGSCSECPYGSYRLAEEYDGLGGACQACPSDSTTLQTGRWLPSQCVCSPNFYDELVRPTPSDHRNANSLEPDWLSAEPVPDLRSVVLNCCAGYSTPCGDYCIYHAILARGTSRSVPVTLRHSLCATSRRNGKHGTLSSVLCECSANHRQAAAT